MNDDKAGVLYWLLERARDLIRWPLLLLLHLPRRLDRLSNTLGRGMVGLANPPSHLDRTRANGQGDFGLRRHVGRAIFWLHQLANELFDLVGGPELAQFIMHLGMHTSPLTEEERAVARSVLGPDALPYGAIRIAQGGILNWVFRYNGGRAFTTWHTIHLPSTGHSTRANVPLLIHELTHVYQYQKLGTRYIGEAVYVQIRQGLACYDYGNQEGLRKAGEQGVPYSAFNREQQAQMVGHYYHRCQTGEDVSDYEPYIRQLRAGRF